MRDLFFPVVACVGGALYGLFFTVVSVAVIMSDDPVWSVFITAPIAVVMFVVAVVGFRLVRDVNRFHADSSSGS